MLISEANVVIEFDASMTAAEVSLPCRSFGQTMRRDAWWAQPLLIFCGFAAFIIYSTWAAFQGAHYHFGPYLSPFYSPEIFGESPHSWFGPKPGWWPSLIPFSPAIRSEEHTSELQSR